MSLQVHETVSGLIRSAIDQVYGKGHRLSFAAAVRQASGVWRSRNDLPATQAHVRGLRRGGRLRGLMSRLDA